MQYSFNSEFAIKYGVNEAIFIHNLYWWNKKNKENNRNFYTAIVKDKNKKEKEISSYWTYNSISSFAEIFPFWSQRQIRTVIGNCKRKGLIYTACLNEAKYDRTLWYAITDKVESVYNDEISQKVVSETSESIAENVQPIPDSKPDNNNYSSNNYLCRNSENYNAKIKKKKIFSETSDPYLLARLLETDIREHSQHFPESEEQRQRWAKDIDLMICKDKLDVDAIAEVIEWCQQDSFWRSNILSGKKLREKYQQLRMKMNNRR